MPSWARTFGFAMVSGTIASATSSLALAFLARLEGRGAFQPVNATSHWWHGDQAASVREADIAHTAVGYVTHHAATIFWAVFYERLIGPRRPVGAVPLLRDALIISAVSAAVDYGATPRRFTPGWEFVLSKQSMAAAYGAMAFGLAMGAFTTQLLAPSQGQGRTGPAKVPIAPPRVALAFPGRRASRQEGARRAAAGSRASVTRD